MSVDDDELEQLRGAAIVLAEDEEELPPPGGFADVLARAHALAAQPPDDGLAPLIRAARRLAEQDAEEREAEGLPPLRNRALQRWVAPAAIVLLAAASALLVIGGLSWVAQRGDEAARSQAVDSAQGGGSTPQSASERAVVPRRERTPSTPEAPQADATTGALPMPPAVDEPPPPRAVVKKVELEERLRALADAAEAALARGELQLADDTLAKLVAIGGKHRLVELAYGDRFTIAHRRGIIAEQTKLWRAYLDRFPHGRFADDARAGLCRHAPEATQAKCWQDYLDAFPKGAYRAAARRSIESDGAP